MVRRSRVGISADLSSALLIGVSIAFAVVMYAFLPGYVSQLSSGGTSTGSDIMSVDGVSRLPSGGLKIFVRSLGSREASVRSVYIYDTSGNLVLTYRTEVRVEPGKVSQVIIPSIYLSKVTEKGVEEVRLRLVSEAGEVAYSLETPKIRLRRTSNVYLALKAIRNRSGRTHWVVFNYVTGEYLLYDNSTAVVKGPYEGIAPILSGVNEYTITTSWVKWGERPIDSPVVIVINPTGGDENWSFTWHAAGRTSKFYLERLPGAKEVDFLVFWEDLFNPFSPPGRVDDWMDHVIRVTLFTNGTYRVAVYVAKGGFSHEFYLNVTSRNPLAGRLIYMKPFGAYWRQRSRGYYVAMPDKIFYEG
ncbi:MAG: hypothetical protein J7L55_02585 [Desulfurococcales archaeon]|nr:hypothetical protein [Desulfurococcales archaeon]